MLAGAARGETGSTSGGGQVKLSDVDTWEFAGFQNQFICSFMLAGDMIGGGTSIPGKGGGGIGCGWEPVDQSSRPCKWNGAHLHI